MAISATRRALLYWLLLLLPTLAAGAGALWLLHREQLRIDARSRATAEARITAVKDRASLIAENIEVLVTDVQNGLMTTLRDAPSDGPAAFLTNWKNANPLVRDVFQSTNDGRIRWGSADRAVTAWLRTTPWIRFATTPPSLVGQKNLKREIVTKQATPPITGKIKFVQAEEIEANASQYENTRNLLQSISNSTKENRVPTSVTQQIDAQNFPAGWMPWIDDNKALHLFGWRLCDNGTVLAVEVDLPALASQLGRILPEKISPNEAYSLRLSDGAAVHQVGFWAKDSPRLTSARQVTPPYNTPVVIVPLSEKNLPGWTVTGALIDDTVTGTAGKFFFTASAALVALFVITILSVGSLLLRQTRRSEIESLQKTSFVANVSHELKTPLTSIRLHAELLEQNRVRDEQQRASFLLAIGRETQRLTRLVNNVLDFSRLEQGRRKFSRVTVDLVEKLNQLLDCHAPRITDAGLVLKRHLPSSPVTLVTDPDAVDQIILNLIDNACKYAGGAGGELEIALAKNSGDGDVQIRIRDRGPGIPASHRKRIFEKFHRVNNTLTAEQGGAGLGLSIAHQLARALGGELRHENRAGGGSEFVLTLPVTVTQKFSEQKS